MKLLLENGGSVSQKNNRGETPIDVISGDWSDELAGFYTAIGNGEGIEVDLKELERQRPRIAELLREHTKKAPAKATGQ